MVTEQFYIIGWTHFDVYETYVSVFDYHTNGLKFKSPKGWRAQTEMMSNGYARIKRNWYEY